MTLTLSLRPDVTVVAVLVPVNMYSFQLGRSIKTLNKIYAQGEYGGCRIDLPPGQYEIVGLLREIGDDAAKSLVGMPITGSVYNFTLTPHLNLLKNKIEWAGGDPELNWLLIKKIQ